MILASHNSGTGERSRRWWHRLVVPFARCQSVSVIQQYNRGVRYFDFRVREKNGVWCFAHGLWESASDPWKVLALLESYSRVHSTEVFVSFTYEGKLDERGKKDFLEMVEKQCVKCPAIKPVQCVVRKPSWEVLSAWEPQQLHYCFHPINFTNKRWMLPIPRLWNKLSPIEIKDEEAWQFCDFV